MSKLGSVFTCKWYYIYSLFEIIKVIAGWIVTDTLMFSWHLLLLFCIVCPKFIDTEECHNINCMSIILILTIHNSLRNNKYSSKFTIYGKNQLWTIVNLLNIIQYSKPMWYSCFTINSKFTYLHVLHPPPPTKPPPPTLSHLDVGSLKKPSVCGSDIYMDFRGENKNN